MILDADVERYLADLAPSTDPVLLEMEAVARERRFPIIGPLVGRLCETLARAIGARRVFELGSGYGYSTVYFARAVGEGGEVVHTDGDAKNGARARDYLERAGLADRVRFLTGDARRLIAAEPGPFDVVFCDIDKDGYPEALDLARAKVRCGGLILTDNVLWSGRVARPDADETTRAIQRYNRAAFAASDLLSTIVPLRDGVGVHLKR
jgi:predicted O-methyltransferase YrrM